MKADIKNPTLRKVRNKGFTPVSYHHTSGVHCGWIFKRGTKWVHAHFPSLGNIKLAKSELRYVREL